MANQIDALLEQLNDPLSITIPSEPRWLTIS